MKNTIKSLKLWVLGCVMLFVGAQSAFAALACEGTVYLKLPDGWKSAYVVSDGKKTLFTKSDFASWLKVSTSDIGQQSAKSFFIEETGTNDCNSGHCIRKDSMNVKYMQLNKGLFTCNDFSENGELWISAHPDPAKENITYASKTPPDVKYFYIFLPNTVEWKSATPMIKEDDKASIAMEIDSDHCGWYFRRYIDEPIPTSVVIHKDSDPQLATAIGMGGSWVDEGTAAEPIPLNGQFELFGSDVLYFVADDEEASKLESNMKGWYTTLPPAEGKCSYELAALIYDTDASLHGAFTCNHYQEACQTNPKACLNNACYYPSAKYNVVSNGTEEVPCIGVIKGMVESTLDDNGRMVLTAKGKKCFGSQADEAFKAMFTYTPNVNEKYCFNMTFNQTADGKFEFDSDTYQSPGATVPGGFYPAEEPPLDSGMISTEKPVMLSARLAAAENKRRAEGPVFFCGDYNNQTTRTPEGLRTVHPKEGVALSDLICNGGGWEGGIECDGLFANGGEFNPTETAGKQIRTKLNVSFEGDGWGWACENMAPIGWNFYKQNTETSVGKLLEKNNKPDGSARWSSGTGEDDSDVLKNLGRNQHFCFESHATFQFKKGLKFSFRGDDDIWVFINKKLAVDLGGTHLAAPGYVDLDKFLPDAEVGDEYPIDIFFCDRRTTMSNVHIKTNMYIQQTSGLNAPPDKAGAHGADFRNNGNQHYKLTYKKSSGKSCAAEVDPTGGNSRLEGKQITDAGITISYELTTDETGQDPTAVIVPADEFVKTPKQYDGGIDVTLPYDPIVNLEKLESQLPPNTYFLFIRIGNDYTKIKLPISGAVSVANRDAVLSDGSLPYKFIDRKMAAIPKVGGKPELDQLVPIYIAPMLDPCGSGAANCTKPLEMQTAAQEQSYTLHSSNKNAVFYELKDGELSQIVKPEETSRTIRAGEIDTVYMTVLARSFTGGKREDTVSVNVTGSARIAKVTFFVPEIVFVDGPNSSNIITGDLRDTVRLKGADDTLYVLALNPGDTECGSACNFSLSLVDASDRVTIREGVVVDGRGYVIVNSGKEYLKNADGTGAAFIDVGVEGASNLHARYDNLQFQDPPVPTVVFADIFDVHGAVPESELNIDAPYFDKTKEYLDGIGDSLMIYYHRAFHQDSLPNKIEVFWENDKDSVVFEGDEIKKFVKCDATTKYCGNRIALSGKKLSKEPKTGGKGLIKSWATFKPNAKSEAITSAFTADIYDRIAPIILSARAKADGKSKTVQLVFQFSEPLEKTTEGSAAGDKVFSFFINNGKERKFAESIDVLGGVSYGQKYLANQTISYSQDAALFPQAGDYVHFRSGNGLGHIADQSDYALAPGADSIRPADDASHRWNVAPGWDSDPAERLPSPWVLISGEVSTYIVRLIPSAKGGIPATRSVSDVEKLPAFEVFSYDANKVDKDFRKDIVAGAGQFAEYGFIPHGWFVKNDMGALVDSREEFAGVDKSTVFFDYEWELFTNLGAVVAKQKGRIACNDQKYFGGDCVKNRRNFFVLWNMKSTNNNKRLVGAGGFISKIKTYVQLGKFGKMAKLEKSEVWGVRHNANERGSLDPDYKAK